MSLFEIFSLLLSSGQNFLTGTQEQLRREKCDVIAEAQLPDVCNFLAKTGKEYPLDGAQNGGRERGG